MALSPPESRIWWNDKVEKGELVWIGIAFIWVVATCLLTPAFGIRQAVTRGFSQQSRLRRAARWLQLGWPVAAVVTRTSFTRWSSGANCWT